MSSPTPARQWTDAQRRGIETIGHSLLVSAAAGSGKTAMLAARCAHLVCDAPDPCEVDELLVVTFTEAAAVEMKSRIHAALRDRAAATDSEKLRRQLALVDQANVSTLHSFCARLLREHFHEVGLDPAFSVLDGEEATLLRREVARTLFDDRYESDAGGDFHRFIDSYGEGDDTRLVQQVIHTYELLRSFIDPQGWLDRSRGRIAEAIDRPLRDSAMGRELIASLSRDIAAARDRCDEALALVQQLEGFGKYVEVLTDCRRELRHWDQTLASDGPDALAEVVQTEPPRLPSISNSVANKEIAKGAVDSVREWMKKGPCRQLLRFTTAQWQEGLVSIRPHAEVFLELVAEFGKRYRHAKDAARVVDFSDLERFSLHVLNEGKHGEVAPSPAARRYHKRFKHVLVDEYQDINEVQDAILSLLSRETVWRDPATPGNLFCVGDVKQSIYRFRLAEPARFLDRQKLFKEASGKPRRGEVIDLQSNFRSRAPLLEAINGVFERLMSAAAVDIDYDQSHRLAAGLVYPAGDGQTSFAGSPIEMHLLPGDLSAGDEEPSGEEADDLELDRFEREAVLVARRIRQLMGLDGSPRMNVMEKDASGAMHPRPIRFGDVVVLLRAMRHKAEQYADILRRFHIPVHADSSTGYFESTEIRDMLCLLSVLDNQRQDIPLAGVLRSPIANLPEPENCLARIRLAYPAEGDQAVAFHDAVVHYAQDKNDELAARLKDFLAQFDQWRRLAHGRPLPQLIWTIYHDSGYLAYCAGLHDGEQRVANLMELHRRAGQFGASRPQTLSRFIQFLHGLRDEADLGQPSVASEADDVVRVMSVHRSKGLEFPVVFLPDLGKRINLQDCQGAIVVDRTAGLGMDVIDDQRLIRYPSLASVLVKQRLKRQALAEEMRVLYVAMTRAREHLVLVGTCKPDAAQKWDARWSGHGGALPEDVVLSAKCMLDWLGPVASSGGGIIHVTPHTPQEVQEWQAEHAKRPALSPGGQAMAALQPLAPAPAGAAEVNDLIRRLEFPYPYQPYTRVAASDSVTRDADSLKTINLDPPRFLAGQTASAADIGTATHRVLQHLDFRRPCDSDDVRAQIAGLVERKLLAPAQVELVDLDSIRWLLDDEVGRLLKEHASSLRRELLIHVAAEPQLPDGASRSNDPQDQVMIRGRIDVLVPTSRGVVLVDYKTDTIPSGAVPRRAEAYATQMTRYRDFIERATGGPVARACLVFLNPRVVWQIEPRQAGST